MRPMLLSAVMIMSVWAMLPSAATAQQLVAPRGVRADADHLTRWCFRAVRRTYGTPGPRGGYRVPRNSLIPLVNNCIGSGGARV
jgi:hypothetical protein